MQNPEGGFHVIRANATRLDGVRLRYSFHCDQFRWPTQKWTRFQFSVTFRDFTAGFLIFQLSSPKAIKIRWCFDNTKLMPILKFMDKLRIIVGSFSCHSNYLFRINCCRDFLHSIIPNFTTYSLSFPNTDNRDLFIFHFNSLSDPASINSSVPVNCSWYGK